jgi:hypothetical protein
MKKILLSLSVLASTIAVNAQVDTLSDFFSGTATLYGVDPATGGYLSGNNGYGDLAKMQLFDANYGVTGTGSITGVCMWAPVKSGTGSFQVKVWSNNAGAPGTELGSSTVSLSAVDTSSAATMIVLSNPGLTFQGNPSGASLYNVAINFASPITIPTSKEFWIGVVLPTGTGDTLAIVTNTDGDFGGAGATHTGEFWSDGVFYTFGDPTNWDLDIALAIYPIVNMVAGIDENIIQSSVYPNPATDVLNIKTDEQIQSVVITSIDGKIVSSAVNATIDVSSLNAGVYVYEVRTTTGKVSKGNFVKQ